MMVVELGPEHRAALRLALHGRPIGDAPSGAIGDLLVWRLFSHAIWCRDEPMRMALTDEGRHVAMACESRCTGGLTDAA